MELPAGGTSATIGIGIAGATMELLALLGMALHGIGTAGATLGMALHGIGTAGATMELLELLPPRHEIPSTGMEWASPHEILLQNNILPIESSGLYLAWLSDEPTVPESLSHGRALPSKQHIDRRRASAPQADSKQHINRRRASTPQER